jgi:hypothetical protein
MSTPPREVIAENRNKILGIMAEELKTAYAEESLIPEGRLAKSFAAPMSDYPAV